MIGYVGSITVSRIRNWSSIEIVMSNLPHLPQMHLDIAFGFGEMGQS